MKKLVWITVFVAAVLSAANAFAMAEPRDKPERPASTEAPSKPSAEKPGGEQDKPSLGHEIKDSVKDKAADMIGGCVGGAIGGALSGPGGAVVGCLAGAAGGAITKAIGGMYQLRLPPPRGPRYTTRRS